MASVPINVEEISEAFKQLTLSGIKLEGRELGRGAYGRVYTMKYRGVVYAAKLRGSRASTSNRWSGRSTETSR